MNLTLNTLTAVIVGMLVGCGDGLPATQTPEHRHELIILSTAEQDTLNLPFAEGVQVGDILYLSGQIGVEEGTLDLVPGGIQAETRQTLENIRAILQRHGSSMNNVIKCTVFLKDMQDWPAMNEVYVEMFAGHRPARSALGASGLALDGHVEIECIALAGTG